MIDSTFAVEVICILYDDGEGMHLLNWKSQSRRDTIRPFVQLSVVFSIASMYWRYLYILLAMKISRSKTVDG